MPTLKTSENIDAVQFEEQAASPATPAAGFARVYVTTTPQLAWRDDGGTVHLVVDGGAGGEVPLADLASYARGSVIRGGAADWEAHDAKTAGAVLIGDGNDITADTTPTFVGATTHSAGSVQGTGGNTATFSAAGVLTLAANARVTRKKQFAPGAWIEGGTAPTLTRTGDYPGYAYTIGDSSLVSLEVPEDADLTTNLTLKVYWYIDEAYATANGEIQWACAYSAVPSNETEAVDAAGYTGDLDAGDQNIPATAKYLTVTTLGTLTGTSLAAGDIVGLEFSRVALDAGVDPTAEPVIVLLTCEYTANKLGA